MACATLKRSLDWEPVLGGRPAKRRRCIPFCGSPSQRDRPSPSSSPSSMEPSSPKQTSVFPDIISKKFTPEYMAENIKAEIKRLQRRKQLQYSTVENSDGETVDTSSKSERALFTFKQVGMICERMIRERESEIREEYDSVLSTKLAEQYDAFVKFTYDQIQKNYNAAAPPSYLS
ncbi:akirin isoform X2 [Aethina tumida]|uniref:akirin isoform X2 n=1 Tax=Aethina tumida TaxID=116153 RepID=UPI00096B5E49|nr:akirin isoform X2 [Aethina tumida]